MKDNELRIGNLVIYGGSVVKMNLHEFTHFLRFPETYTPITLTEEILLKCGFEKREDGDYNLFKNSEVDIVICSDFSSWKCDGINFSVNYIKHLHQLQNLYFALTGEDLEINL